MCSLVIYRRLLTIDSATSGDEHLSEDIDQLFELTKIMVLVLSGLVPGLEDSNTKGMSPINKSHEQLLTNYSTP
jgi:hypothetical protein